MEKLLDSKYSWGSCCVKSCSRMSNLSLKVPVALVSESIKTTVVRLLPSVSFVGATARSVHDGPPNVSHRASTNCSIRKLGFQLLSVLIQPKLSTFTSLPRLLVNLTIAVNLFCGPNVALDTWMLTPFELPGLVNEHEQTTIAVTNERRIRPIAFLLSSSTRRHLSDRIAWRLTSANLHSDFDTLSE